MTQPFCLFGKMRFESDGKFICLDSKKEGGN